MAENKLTMFGKTYNTVGSADSNLLLQTRGDLKIRWGNTFIDLIKNGKINANTDLIFKVESKDKIIKDGIYLIDNEDTSEIWLSVGGTTKNVSGGIDDNYLTFIKDLTIDSEGRFRALKNIGYYQSSYNDLENAGFQSGLFFVLDENQLYFVRNGEIVKYEQLIKIPNPLLIGSVVIDGENSQIISSKKLSIIGNGILYISFNDINIFNRDIEVNNNIFSKNFREGEYGYKLLLINNISSLEIDDIIVRRNIIENNEFSYEELRQLMSNGKLTIGKTYIIKDFINDWEFDEFEPIYHSIIIKALTKYTLEKQGYYCDNPNWIIEYDPYYIGEENNYRGRITKLTDEFGNSLNYDFKHKLFKHTITSNTKRVWFFTFNISKRNVSSNVINSIKFYNENEKKFFDRHDNMDASLLGNIKNNILNIEDLCIIFLNCNINYPCNNTILNGKGSYVITEEFYGNNINEIYCNNYTFTSDFYNNTIKKLYLEGDENSLEAEKTVIFYQECHDSIFEGIVTDSILNGSISNTTFKSEVNLLDFSGNISNSIFYGKIDNVTIAGNINDCKFLKLSDSITLSDTLSNVNILSDITPLSAEYVQVNDTLSQINTLEINTTLIPKLASLGLKYCYIKTIDNKEVFYVTINNTDSYMPSGTIVMFGGNQIPDGWAICDGTNGTPNLTGRFIRMIDTGESVGPKNNNDLVTNGTGTRQAYINKSIAHTHSYNSSATIDYSGLTIDYNGGNLINGYTEDSTVEVYRISATGTDTTYAEGAESTYVKEGLENQGLHNHEYNITLPSIEVSGDITATVTVTQNTEAEASNFVTAINVEPLAYALIFIMKL